MSNLSAVIVETRPLPNLVEIIQDHLNFLPDYTRLHVFGSKAVRKIIGGHFDCLFIDIGDHMDEKRYNHLLTSPFFWNAIFDENILIFQHDSRLLRHGIGEFYQWDYVGAPWKFQLWGGNGGLSFRHKSAMLKVIVDKASYNQSIHGNEDVFFCNAMGQEIAHGRFVAFHGLNLAPPNICKQFSCESIFTLGTLGFHAIDKYLTKKQCEQIKNQYAVSDTGENKTVA